MTKKKFRRGQVVYSMGLDMDCLPCLSQGWFVSYHKTPKIYRANGKVIGVDDCTVRTHSILIARDSRTLHDTPAGILKEVRAWVRRSGAGAARCGGIERLRARISRSCGRSW